MQVTGQRRGRKIAMSAAELDDFLGTERTCRIATVGGTGGPHVTALWFVWLDGSLWLYSLTRSQRWTDLTRDPRIAVLVDSGHDYDELRGVELLGAVEPVGEAPRTGLDDGQLIAPERAFAEKYFGIAELPHDGKHGWLRLTPHTIRSWDFRKLAELGAG